METLNKQKKTIFSTLTTGIRVLGLFLVFIVTLFFLTAPMLHMVASNDVSEVYLDAKDKFKNKEISKSEYEVIRRENTYFGYRSKRMLWYAIGMPLLLSYVSVLLLYVASKLEKILLRKIINIISICSSAVSFYFLIWALWYRADFPKHWYYISIGVLSLASVVIIKLIIKLLQHEEFKRVQQQAANNSFLNQGFEILNLLNKKYVN